MEVILAVVVGGAIGAAILAAWALWLRWGEKERGAAMERQQQELESVERRLTEYHSTPPKNPST
jgi:hypothetical protein